MLCREALIWKRLIHPNIVPFRGATISPLQIMSEWMSGGDLTTYINLNPDVNRVALVSLLVASLPKRYLITPAVGRCRKWAPLSSLLRCDSRRS